MIERHRKPLVLATVGASFALNAAFLAYHARAGSFRRALVRLDLVEAIANRSSYQEGMEARYRKLPDRPGGVVFAGDSLIHRGEWSEFYGAIHNRGIPNETSAQLLGRLGDLLRTRPRGLVLLTGSNDLSQGVPITQLVRNYRAILEKAKVESPSTAVAVIGLAPVDPSIPGGPTYGNPAVLEANRRLEVLARESPGVRFLDPTGLLAGESGRLRREFTDDGLHLTLDGYLALLDAVRPLVERPDLSGNPTSGSY